MSSSPYTRVRNESVASSMAGTAGRPSLAGSHLQEFSQTTQDVDVITFWAQFRALALRNLTLLSKQRTTIWIQSSVPILIILCIAITQYFVNRGSNEEVDCGSGPNTLASGFVDLSLRRSCRSLPGDVCSESYNILWVESESAQTTEGGEFEDSFGRYPFVGATSSYDGSAGPNESALLFPLFTPYSSLDAAIADWESVWNNESFCQNVRFPTALLQLNAINQTTLSASFLVPVWDGWGCPSVTDTAGQFDFVSYNENQGNFQVNQFVNLLDNAVLAYNGLPNVSIFTTIDVFPLQLNISCPTNYSVRTITALYISMMPFCFSFLLPVFVATLVREKESRLLHLMAMSGLQSQVFWLVTFGFDYLMYVTLVVLATLTMLLVGVQVLVQSNFFTYFFLFLAWGVALAAMAYFIAAFFDSSIIATLVSYGFIIVFYTCSLVLYAVYEPPFKTAVILAMLPPFAFVRALVLLGNAVVDNQPLKFGALLLTEPFGSQVAMLIADSLVLFVVTVYLDRVLPKKFGVKRNVCFCIEDAYLACCSRAYSDNLDGEVFLLNAQDTDEFQVVSLREAADCAAERARAHRPKPTTAIVVRDLTKVFVGLPRPALEKFCLTVEPGECIALLGPNGAGKSTLISILSGQFGPTGGDAIIGGHSILTATNKVYTQLGVCPQVDIVWDDLSVWDHVLFFARLKGVPPADEYFHVESIIDDVGLHASKLKPARVLSAGVRRRLSIANALVGGPRVLILDEPTTGLDPESRRIIWDILQRAKIGRSVLLATHSMEEAKILSTRIVIMSVGRMKCIGTHRDLQQRLGEDYKLRVRCQTMHVSRVKAFIASQWPNSVVESTFAGVVIFSIRRADFNLGSFFHEMEVKKVSQGILDWSLSKSSLEEVFVSIIRTDEGLEAPDALQDPNPRVNMPS